MLEEWAGVGYQRTSLWEAHTSKESQRPMGTEVTIRGDGGGGVGTSDTRWQTLSWVQKTPRGGWLVMGLWSPE